MSKKFGVYFVRWQISAWVMLPVMLVLASFGMPLWANLMIGQAFGSFIFWEIDKHIFKTHSEDTLEHEMNAVYKVEPSTKKI